MTSQIKKGFVLAAGLGTRMRHLTNDRPKSMLEVVGRTMLDHAIDALARVGVEEVVVNTHYFADMVEEHIKKRDDVKIIISREEELLETGGGVKKALEFFDDEPFYVLNSDVIWLDEAEDSLSAMADAWDNDKMDLMLLLHPHNTARFYAGPGDYYMEGDCKKPIMCKFGRSDKEANYVVAGPRIVHPRLFKNTQEGKWSFLDLFLKAEDIDKLYGFAHKGEWFHVGTPEALEETNKIFADKKRKLSI